MNDDTKWARREFFTKILPLLLPIVVFVVGSIVAVGYFQTREKTKQLVNQATQDTRVLTVEVQKSAQAIKSVAGPELTDRVNALIQQVNKLESSVASLQQVISPNNAPDILTTAKLRDEILARQKFEDRVNSAVKVATDRVDGFHNWLLGIAGTIIVSLLTFAWILLRRTALLYDHVRSLETELKRAPEIDQSP